MPRILGVDVPNDKPTYISLQYLHGIGQTTALQMCKELQLNPQTAARDMSDDDIQKVNAHLEDVDVEGALRRQTAANITRLKDIRSYRGIRHRQNLPVRGQKTQTNARTRKGSKKTVAGKKGVKDMRH